MLTFLHHLLIRLASAEVADACVRELQHAFGGGRHYIKTPPDERRAEALLLLRAGHPVGEVARRVGVHGSTVYRWWKSREQRLAHRESTGLARSKDWTL